MDFIEIKSEFLNELMALQKAYKAEIGECAPTSAELESLKRNRYIFMDVYAITHS